MAHLIIRRSAEAPEKVLEGVVEKIGLGYLVVLLGQ